MHSHEIYLVPLWEVVGEEIGEAVVGLQGRWLWNNMLGGCIFG